MKRFGLALTALCLSGCGYSRLVEEREALACKLETTRALLKADQAALKSLPQLTEEFHRLERRKKARQ